MNFTNCDLEMTFKGKPGVINLKLIFMIIEAIHEFIT